MGTLVVLLALAQQVFSDRDPGINPPRVIEKAGGEYTEEARLARLEGSVGLTAVVDENGAVRDIHVSRSLGLGLDESAIEAARLWHFAPGTKGEQPVAVLTHFDVNFKMLTERSTWRLTRADFETQRGASRPMVLRANFPPPQTGASKLVISFDVDEHGNATNISEPEFANLMSGWQFEPARMNGKPVRVHATFAFANS